MAGEEEDEIIEKVRYYKILELQRNKHFGDILMS